MLFDTFMKKLRKHLNAMETSHSLRLSNGLVASIGLPEANINKDLIEFLHPEIPLFLGVRRQPVPTGSNTHMLRTLSPTPHLPVRL